MVLPRSAELQWQQEIIEHWLETPSIPSDSRTGLIELLKAVKEEREKLHVQTAGSDWPHPDIGAGRKPSDVSPLLRIDDGHLLNLLGTWVPDAALRKTTLVDNPATLYRSLTCNSA